MMDGTRMLSDARVGELVRLALDEDIGRGDVTTDAVVGADQWLSGAFVVEADGVFCGWPVAEAAFTQLDPRCRLEGEAREGLRVSTGDTAARIVGPARAILTAERVALNFLQRLSGIATVTRSYVEVIRGAKAVILDTRKTTPGLRELEKYAVRSGGASNHRFGLDDGVLIKDNHIEAAGGLSAAVRRARRIAPHTLKIEVECDTLAQVDEALASGADILLLDNMSVDQLRTAVERVAGRVLLEASGGVNLETVRAIAETGVNFISVGALTHSAPILPMRLDCRLCGADG
jgi:nicotinate-nucleotide pyrophosphorylase (carboxylating)